MQRKPLYLGLALCLALGQCGYTYAALTTEYLFEEGSGITANDTSINARHATLLGTTGVPGYVPGLYNGSNFALQFNFNSGTAAYDPAMVQRVAPPVPNDYIRNAAAATLLAWVRADSGIGQTLTFFAVDNEATAARANIQMTGNGQFRVLGRKGAEANSTSYLTPVGAITAGTTYLVAGVMDYAAGDISLYINGQLHTGGTKTLRAEYIAAGNSADTTNARGAIGSNTAQAAEQFLGAIDGVRLYNEALSASQILAIYNAEVVPEPTSIALLAIGGAALMVRRRRA